MQKEISSMEEITKYRAFDGSEFDSKKDCWEYEKLLERIDRIMSYLPERPATAIFVTGLGYLQHNGVQFFATRMQLLQLCREYSSHPILKEAINNKELAPAFVTNAIDDTVPEPLALAWWRFECTDSSLREWFCPNCEKYRRGETTFSLNLQSEE
jgi:hypothetical protein